MNTPTPRTDKLYSDHIQDPLQSIGDLAAIMHNQCERFERELTAVTEERDRLAEAIRLTLMENLDLCDGDQCTLKCLKDAIGFDLDSSENDKVEHTHPNYNNSMSLLSFLADSGRFDQIIRQ